MFEFMTKDRPAFSVKSFMQKFLTIMNIVTKIVRGS